EELASIRPALDGHRVMELLGVPPGKVVGEALAMLLDARIDEGPMTEEEAERRLLAWAEERGLRP
ncbi:MAG TPA: CCA tRNA nucleotidyltransferase, partial [Acidimicrobiia bacterium]|nr:CCA tRNA nucleotidyltransferase [Acidimicrobiia bacterium]